MRRSTQFLRMDRRLLILTVGLALAVSAIAVLTASSAGAAPSSQEVSNDTCLSCHGQPDLSKTLPSGETWSLFIDQSHFSDSVHGEEEVACVECHERNAVFHTPNLSWLTCAVSACSFTRPARSAMRSSIAVCWTACTSGRLRRVISRQPSVPIATTRIPSHALPMKPPGRSGRKPAC
jgi:cytochrome c553